MPIHAVKQQRDEHGIIAGDVKLAAELLGELSLLDTGYTSEVMGGVVQSMLSLEDFAFMMYLPAPYVLSKRSFT